MKKMELSEKNVKHLLYISCVCEVNRIINIKKKKYILNKIVFPVKIKTPALAHRIWKAE